MKLTIVDDRNEVDQNAMGGTELMGAGLKKHVSEKLLSKFNIIRSRVRHVSEDKPNILWLHDLPQDPESRHLADPESLKRFDRLVYVSNWQKDMYQLFLGIPPSKGVVIQNAIEPIEPELIKKGEDGKIRLIYHPTPHRGLNILYPVFDKLSKEFPGQLHLDVFSSFKLYGWEQRDEEFRELIDHCKAHPDITYHGTQPQEVVRAALGKADFFAYPSIWQETSCICALEAMSAGCIILAPNYAALPETTAGFAVMYDWTENMQDHCNLFYSWLKSLIVMKMKKPDHFDVHLAKQKDFVDGRHSWVVKRQHWNSFLNDQLVDSDERIG